MAKKEMKEAKILEGTEEGEILSKLADRVERAVQSIQQLRKERDELKARLERSEDDLRSREESSESLGRLQEENERYQSERGEIRGRIESLLETLEQLEEQASIK